MRDHKVLALDLETTGPDPETARIVQLAIVLGPRPLAERMGGSALVNPGVPIPEEATEVHGITDEDVENEPPFRVIAHRIQAALQEHDFVVTYNGRTFDIPILDRELREAGEPGVDHAEIREVDLYQVWKALEPRDLETAVRRFAGGQEFDAHDAHEDARVLFDVLQGMKDEFGALPMYPENGEGRSIFDTFARLTTPEDAVDRFGYFRRREDGVVVFAFSGNEGDPVSEHPGMVDWMERKGFPEAVLEIARREVAADRSRDVE